MKQEISVTAEDIAAAKYALITRGTFVDKFYDPVAQALRRTMETKRVFVNPYTAEIDGDFYELSQAAIDAGRKWCQGEEVEPFTFTIEKKVINHQRKPKDS